MTGWSRPKPALERHVVNVYNYMSERAVINPVNGDNQFTGKLTDIFAELRISTAFYTPIRRLLMDTGSIELIERGTKAAPSVVALRHPPPEQKLWPEPLTPGRESATLHRKEVERRLAVLEGWRETLGGGRINLAEVLRNFEARISALEREQRKQVR
jgi:hypothetical protein